MTKKRVKKYKTAQLLAELDALGFSLDDCIRKERKNRRMKKNLQKLLIWEEMRRATYYGPAWVEDKRDRSSLPYPIPRDIVAVLKELNALDSILSEYKCR